MARIPVVCTSCKTCRNRKKGCDKNRPQCYRCIKAGLLCGGYDDHSLIWMNLDATEKTLSSYLRRRKCLEAICIPTADIILPEALGNSATEQLIFGAFISAIWPGGRQYSTEAIHVSSVGWINLIPNFQHRDNALRYATIAIGTVLMSIDYQDDSLHITSVQTYNRAVFEVVKALKHKNWTQRDGLLIAARLLSFYEIIVPPKRHLETLEPWKGHNEGMQAMFLARGPHAFVSGAAHQLYVDARINMIILAIEKRMRSPFSGSLWKTVPWSLHRRSIKDELLDILQELPAVLEQAAVFESSSSTGTTRLFKKSILNQCSELEQALDVWLRKASGDIAKFDVMATALPLPAPKNDSEFGILHLSITYWIGRMLLYSIMNHFCSATKGISMNGKSADNASLELAGPGGDNHKPASRSPHIYFVKLTHAIHLYWENGSCITEKLSGLLALGYVMRYSLKQELVDDERLYAVLAMKTFGTHVRQLLKKLGGAHSPAGSTSANKNVSGDSISWL